MLQVLLDDRVVRDNVRHVGSHRLRHDPLGGIHVLAIDAGVQEGVVQTRGLLRARVEDCGGVSEAALARKTLDEADHLRGFDGRLQHLLHHLRALAPQGGLCHDAACPDIRQDVESTKVLLVGSQDGCVRFLAAEGAIGDRAQYSRGEAPVRTLRQVLDHGLDECAAAECGARFQGRHEQVSACSPALRRLGEDTQGVLRAACSPHKCAGGCVRELHPMLRGEVHELSEERRAAPGALRGALLEGNLKHPSAQEAAVRKLADHHRQRAPLHAQLQELLDELMRRGRRRLADAGLQGLRKAPDAVHGGVEVGGGERAPQRQHCNGGRGRIGCLNLVNDVLEFAMLAKAQEILQNQLGKPRARDHVVLMQDVAHSGHQLGAGVLADAVKHGRKHFADIVRFTNDRPKFLGHGVLVRALADKMLRRPHQSFRSMVPRCRLRALLDHGNLFDLWLPWLHAVGAEKDGVHAQRDQEDRDFGLDPEHGVVHCCEERHHASGK
mmetsp:Transcript_77028/g.237841  ORF Transcript_77028/g.237841 Transcript_77028/m.237841 type:complete len:496 (-) Transcript_77028:77-1564(-)